MANVANELYILCVSRNESQQCDRIVVETQTTEPVSGVVTLLDRPDTTSPTLVGNRRNPDGRDVVFVSTKSQRWFDPIRMSIEKLSSPPKLSAKSTELYCARIFLSLSEPAQAKRGT